MKTDLRYNCSGSEERLLDGFWKHGRYYGSWKRGKYVFPIDSVRSCFLDFTYHGSA